MDKETLHFADLLIDTTMFRETIKGNLLAGSLARMTVLNGFLEVGLIATCTLCF